jgi:hypothetical protein
MSLGKKTIKRVQSVLKDDEKRKLYTEAELLYMEKQLILLKELRKSRVQERKENKGFSSTQQEGLPGSSLRATPRPTE